MPGVPDEAERIGADCSPNEDRPLALPRVGLLIRATTLEGFPDPRRARGEFPDPLPILALEPVLELPKGELGTLMGVVGVETGRTESMPLEVTRGEPPGVEELRGRPAAEYFSSLELSS